MINVAATLKRGDFALDISFESDAHVLGVFGPSGAGKTTLINIIAGLEAPDSGAITVNDRTLFDRTRRINIPAHRRRIGLVFQEHRLFPHYSVRRNLTYGARSGHDRLQSIVDLLEVGPLLERPVAHLSGGERQRIALGRALLSEPRMLLLDEPLASLDYRLRGHILPYLRRVCDELSLPIVYVSHELAEILQLTDHLLIMEHGTLAGHGRYAELVHDDDVLDVVHDRGMINMLEAKIATRHESNGIAELALGQSGKTTLVAPLPADDESERVRITIKPWDIALAVQPVEGVSIQNQIAGTVTRRTDHKRRVLVEVDIGVPILVEISNRSANAMHITTGTRIHCLIKSHAIRYATGGERRLAGESASKGVVV